MSPDTFELKPGAVLVADAHYGDKRPELLDFLKAVASGGVPATQLILMGDIFDLLFGGIPVTQRRNAEAVGIINDIASRMDVLYFEGNHDFQLVSVFPKVRVVPLGAQPLMCRFGTQKVMLAHGDWGMGAGYRFYTAVIRSRPVLALLNVIDALTSHAIIRWLDGYLSKKEDCNDFSGFEGYVSRRLERIKPHGTDWFMEGHFHQNKGFETPVCRYFNLAAFACNQRYFELQSNQDEELFLREAVFSKECRDER